MSEFLIIVSVCIVVTVFAINNAKMVKLEDKMDEIQNNMQAINKIAGDAIESFGKFVDEIKKAADAAKAEQQKSENNA